jgi:2-phosphosulfolactate phosphatase
VKVEVGCYIESIGEPDARSVVVAVDVIRSTTTATTAVAAGHRCFVVPSLDASIVARDGLGEAYLVGELGGNMPFGFDATNSPVAVNELAHRERPVVLLSSSGTRLMTDASERGFATWVASLRNWRAQAERLVRDAPDHVLILGAGTRGEFREEDQLCCAWIAQALVAAGFDSDAATLELIARWQGAPVTAITGGKSAAYLIASGQLVDLEFILSHVDDLDDCFLMHDNEVRRLAKGDSGAAP